MKDDRELFKQALSEGLSQHFDDVVANAPVIDLQTGIELTPGDPDGSCLGNGLHEGYECCCDECDYLALCMEKAPD